MLPEAVPRPLDERQVSIGVVVVLPVVAEEAGRVELERLRPQVGPVVHPLRAVGQGVELARRSRRA